jgi:hypothetical protein
MRYFLSKNGVNVVDKQVFSGDDKQINAIVAMYISKNPSFVVSEVDQVTFDVTVMTPTVTPDQQAWQTAKGLGPVAQLTFLAKRFGLE